MKIFRFLLSILMISPVFLAGVGTGGCGGGGSGGGGGGTGTGADDGEPGIAVDSVSDIPSLNISDYYDTGSAGLTTALKAQTTSDTGGGFCKEVCYLNQCLQETLRHSVEIEFFLCMSRKAKEASGGVFDFPDSGCNFFEVTPPDFGSEFEGEGPPAVSTVRKRKLQLDTPSLIQMRLCRSGDTVTFHMCEESTLQQEISITNDTAAGSISATATNSFPFGECDDRGQMSITSNCEASAFSSPECIASFDAKFNGCFGSGTINYGVTGGTTRTNNLEANFDAGGTGADEFGSFSVCVLGEWTGGANGCFKADSTGSFPAFSAAEIPFLGDIPGCETLAAGSPTNLCPNDNFDPELCFDTSGNYDPTNCSCPFAEATGETCAFSFADTQCCAISGATIAEQGGTIISDDAAGDLFTEIDSAVCPEPETEVNFLDEWDCLPEGSFTDVDLFSSDVDFSECFALFEELFNSEAGNNCEQEDAQEGGGDITGAIEGSTPCTSDIDCPTGQQCHIFEGDPNGICVEPPPSCTTDDDCVAGCPEGETCTCEFFPDLGANTCVIAFTCASSEECPPGATCNSSTSQCEFTGP